MDRLTILRRIGLAFFRLPLLWRVHLVLVWVCERYIQAWTSFTVTASDVKKQLPVSLRHGDLWSLWWLFNNSPSNRGLLRMDLDEASALWRFCADVQDGAVVELGRYHGGSTILIASALRRRAVLVSIDSRPKADDSLVEILRFLRISDRVELIRADSVSSQVRGPIRLVFVDANHTYRGARADVLAWGDRLEPGGHLVLHDAAKARWNATTLTGPSRVMGELDRDRKYVLQEEVGSLACFRKDPS